MTKKKDLKKTRKFAGMDYFSGLDKYCGDSRTQVELMEIRELQ